MTLPHAEFQRVIDVGDQTVVLLASHWIALKHIMATICEAEDKAAAVPRNPDGDSNGRQGTAGDEGVGILRWLSHLNRLVDREHARYNEWPAWVEAELVRDWRVFGRTRR